MPAWARSVGALGLAALMVVGAVAGRRALDDREREQGLRLRLACDAAALVFCEAARQADPRVELVVGDPTSAVAGADEGRPPFELWVSIGPRAEMADGRRAGPFRPSTTIVASTPVVLIGPQASFTGCAPAACATRVRNIAMADPTADGAALAAVATIVATASGVPVRDLDRSSFEGGAGGAALRALQKPRRVDAPPGFVANSNFSVAQLIVTTGADAVPLRNRPNPPRVEPLGTHAALQVSAFDAEAGRSFAFGPGLPALVQAATAAGWDAPPAPIAGADPGALAALVEAYPRA